MAERRSPLQVLAFEPFDDGSHAAVRASISQRSTHRWTWITRPGRAWKWRMRLAAFEMAPRAAASAGSQAQPDVILATSLMSASDLRAALPAAWRNLPLALYMHENQAVYPAGAVRWSEVGSDSRDATGRPGEAAALHDAHFALTNLTSVLAADMVIWNSRWNLRSFLDGIGELLSHAPDPELGRVRDAIERRSRVIWPPVEPPPRDLRVLHKQDAARTIAAAGAPPTPRDRPRSPHPVHVAWPHRWEHDKGPDELLRLARECAESLNLRWTILGQRFRQIPSALELFQREFSDRIDHIGFVPDRAEYWRKLAGCDWVLSTARHEFFGISVVEALLTGCLPWLPDRLSYTELLPAEARGLSPLKPPAEERLQTLRSAIARHLEPALAPNAVASLDQAIIDCAAGCGRDAAGQSPFAAPAGSLRASRNP